MSRHDDKDWTVSKWEISPEKISLPEGCGAVMDGDWCVAIVLSDNEKPVAKRTALISAAPELLAIVEDMAYMFQDSLVLNHANIARIIAKAKGLKP